MKRIALLLALAVAAPAYAQTATHAAHAADPGVAASKIIWQMQSNYVLKAAEQMPEAEYGFRPAPTVRTFGQMVGHVAGAQNMFCAMVLGEAGKPEDDIEKRMTTKTDLIAALKASTANCARAYAISDAAASDKIKMFGNEQTKMFALQLNGAHNAEHYGNLITYLRIKGMVPPSSQPQK